MFKKKTSMCFVLSFRLVRSNECGVWSKRRFFTVAPGDLSGLEVHRALSVRNRGTSPEKKGKDWQSDIEKHFQTKKEVGQRVKAKEKDGKGQK